MKKTKKQKKTGKDDIFSVKKIRVPNIYKEQSEYDRK